MRWSIELAGVSLLVASAFTISITVGLAVTGIMFVLVANFAGENDDADVEERDPISGPTSVPADDE